MRTLRIDFTAENMLPDGDMAGRMGEHNATDLVITPPAEMTQCNEIVNYVAAFVTEGKIIRTDFYPKAEQITVSLCSQLTQDHTVSVQLEAYDDKGGLVVKSPVSELRLLPSAGGDETDFDCESGGIVTQINLNTLARHSHKNGDVLEKFGEESGKLTFGGKVVGDGNLKIATAEYFNADGNVNFWYEDSQNFTSGEKQYKSKRIFGYFIKPVPELPCGTMIARVEIKTETEGDYVSVDSLCMERASLPVQKNINEVVYDKAYGDMFFAAFCVFGYEGTKWEDIIDNMEWHSVRITYYKE